MGETAEKPHLDDASGLWMVLREFLERLLERDQHVVRLLGADDQGVIQGDLHAIAAPLLTPASPRMVDQDPPHRLTRYGEEVRAVLPLAAGLIHEAQVRLVDQLGRLEGVLWPFAA